MLQMIRLDELNARSDADAASYKAARPFKHIVIDDFIQGSVRDSLEAAFPGPEWPQWDHGRGAADPYQPKKLTCADSGSIPAPLDQLIYELNSGPIIAWLEKVTGIQHLLPDPLLVGGGLHSSGPGGHLSPHTDFHIGKNPELHRRLNLLVYLNKNWLPENNGAFELWDQKKDVVELEILPVLGRTVIFQTDADSMHGFSKPIAGRFRKSLALYYYTAQAPYRYSGDYATHWRVADDVNGSAPVAPKRPLRSFWLLSARVLSGVAYRMTKASHRLESFAGRNPW